MSEVLFRESDHFYKCLDPDKGIKWKSVSTLIHHFEEPFDKIKKSESSSKNRKSKWFGIPPEEIREIWQNENLRSTTLGTWYHKKEEEKLTGQNSIMRYGCELPIIRPVVNKDGWKESPVQKLTDGVYPELLVYLESIGVCGQADDITVVNKLVYCEDHKSNKDLKKEAFIDWEGKTKKLLAPLAHLEDTILIKYALQLSTYMYIILRHNPQHSVGGLTLNHVTFEVKGEDRFGYPILRLDDNNEPIVKNVERIHLDYMKREVEIMFQWLKDKTHAVR